MVMKVVVPIIKGRRTTLFVEGKSVLPTERIDHGLKMRDGKTKVVVWVRDQTSPT
jgi:hypothetical protein